MSNIFSPTFGNKPQYLVGRDNEISNVMEGLSGVPGHHKRSTFLIGQRGMGKTVLMLELAEQAKKMDYITVRVTANEKMLDEIIEGVQSSGERLIKDKKLPVKTISAGAFGFSIGLTFTDEIQKHHGFRTKISLLCEVLTKQNKGVLFLIDEIRASTAEMRQFATTYQHMIGDGMNIAAIMAGLPHAISSVLNDDVLTFLNRAYKIKLNPLNIADVSACYYKALRSFNIGFDAKLLDKAAEATDGYPYLLQLIGYHIINLLDGETELSKEIVELSIINSKRALKNDIFLPCLKPLSPEDKRFLKTMSKDSEESSLNDIQDRLKANKSHTQTYKRRLIESGLIHTTSRGMVAFSIPYLGQYLRGEIS